MEGDKMKRNPRGQWCKNCKLYHPHGWLCFSNLVVDKPVKPLDRSPVKYSARALEKEANRITELLDTDFATSKLRRLDYWYLVVAVAQHQRIKLGPVIPLPRRKKP